jgi:hypothetical protein
MGLLHVCAPLALAWVFFVFGILWLALLALKSPCLPWQLGLPLHLSFRFAPCVAQDNTFRSAQVSFGNYEHRFVPFG